MILMKKFIKVSYLNMKWYNQNKDEVGLFLAPPMCWNKDRIYSDLKLSKELIKVLDKEKEIETIPKFMKDIEGIASYLSIN